MALNFKHRQLIKMLEHKKSEKLAKTILYYLIP